LKIAWGMLPLRAHRDVRILYREVWRSIPFFIFWNSALPFSFTELENVGFAP